MGIFMGRYDFTCNVLTATQQRVPGENGNQDHAEHPSPHIQWRPVWLAVVVYRLNIYAFMRHFLADCWY